VLVPLQQDGYGEHADGGPFDHWVDGRGAAGRRARALQTLEAGNPVAAKELLRVMEFRPPATGCCRAGLDDTSIGASVAQQAIRFGLSAGVGAFSTSSWSFAQRWKIFDQPPNSEAYRVEERRAVYCEWRSTINAASCRQEKICASR
jgi:hypothetical protein